MNSPSNLEINPATGRTLLGWKAPKSERDYQQVGKDRCIRWVGRILPKNVNTRTEWECKQRHRWSTHYNSIKQGTGCPHCNGKLRKTEDDYRSLALSKGFKWDGKSLPKNTSTKTVWECAEGHRWIATYSKIGENRGCPRCASDNTGSKGEQLVATYLDSLSISYERQKQFDGCRCKLPLRYDFYIPSLNVLIEYHGRQHFEQIDYFGGRKEFLQTQKRDRIKRSFAVRMGIRLVEIRFDESVESRLSTELRGAIS